MQADPMKSTSSHPGMVNRQVADPLKASSATTTQGLPVAPVTDATYPKVGKR